MTSSLPKVRNTGRNERFALWALIGIVLSLLVVIGVLLLGGSLFDSSPASGLERDYAVLAKGLADDPENAAILMTLAETEYELGKKSESLEHAAKAVKVSEGQLGMPLRYAQLLLLEGRLDEAEKQIREEIKLDTNSEFADAHFILGQILFEKGEGEDAIVEMEAGFAIDYTAADVRIVYAEMLAAAGQKDRAIQEFQTALQFLPGDSRAVDGLAELGVTYEATSTANPHETTTDTIAP